MPNSASPRSPGPAGQEPGRPSILSPTGGKNSLKNELHREISRENSANKDYANPPIGVGNANLAVARGDVTSGLPPATSSNGAARALRNWADCPEDQGPGVDDDFTVVRTKKRRRESANSPTAVAPSPNIGGARTSRRPQSSAGSVPRAQEVRTTRAHITEARARQASSSEDHCVYLEHGPELQPFHYLRALDRMFGGTAGVIQVSKVNGHQLLGLANRGLAERLINEGLEVEGTLLRAFPFRKRAERITVGNLPFFVEDSAIISALKPYGRVTSIAPKLMKASPYTYNDGRREAFIVLREGMTTERLPTRLEIPIKGEAWPAYLSSGIKCSRCRGQGHRRANCPLLAGRTNAPGPATFTSPTSVPSATAPGLPQQPSAQPPPSASPSPTMELSDVPPASCAALFPPAAPRPPPPAPLALPVEDTSPAPPPVIPAPSLRAPGGSVSPQSTKSGPPAQDIEMTAIEESSASSTSSSRTSMRDDLVAFIRRSPTVSFTGTDALGLGREEVLDLLSSRTKAQRKRWLLTPPQTDALAGLIKQILGLKPAGNTNVYKILHQVKSELKKGPAAVPPTPPLPAPWPAEPAPPALQERESTPAMATPPPPTSAQMEADLIDKRCDELQLLTIQLMKELNLWPQLGSLYPDLVEAKNISISSDEFQKYVNPPAGGQYANPAAPTNFDTASFSEAAAQANRSWADLAEDNNPEHEDNYTTVQRKKRRRGSAESPAAAAPSSNIRGAGAIRRPQSSTGWAPRAEEIRTTRAHIAEARARQASSTEDHCVYVERSPELEPFHYMRAIERMFGSTREVFQVTKMNGHFLVGLANRGMAERLVNEGLEVEGTLHRAFPFRKRAERITVGNLPFFVWDATVISALSAFGRVTSIAPKLMKAGPYIYNDGRREAFIILREGMTIEGLPTRLNITIKGEAWPAYLSSGIRCSRCRGQGHRRANCPLLAGRTNAPGPATLTSPTSVPSATAPGLPQQPSAQPPPSASPSPTMELSDVPPASRAALLPPAAPRPPPPAPLALPVEDTSPAPPPVIPAPSLRAPGGSVSPQSTKSGPPAQDIEMTAIEESSASSTSSSRTSMRDDLVAFIRRSPTVSFTGTDALGLGREEVLDLLSSRTKAQRKRWLLTPPQTDALAGLIKQILGLKPAGNTNVYKILHQVKSELKKGPAAVPPTPPLPAPWPAEPAPPAPQERESTPAMATPPPPTSAQMEADLIDKRCDELQLLTIQLMKELNLRPQLDSLYPDLVEAGQDAARNEISETYPNTLRRMINRTIRNDKGEPKCFNCNQFEHIARDCPAPRTTLTCRGCGQTGHKERNCTRPKEGLKVANLEVEGLETVPPDVYLKDVKIDNKETVKAMIDTGSSSCLMRKSVARRISVDIEPDSTSLYGIGNQTAPAARTVGKTTVDLEIDGIVGREITVFIVNDDAQPYDLLIGRTWTDLPYVSFARIGKNLHIGYSSEFPFANLQEEIKSRRIELRATETVQLESDSINFTSAITDEVKDGYVLFTGVDDACVDSLLEVFDGKTTVPIISAGKGKLRVRKNQCVGRVELLNLDDIVVNLDVAEDSFQTKNEEKREGQDQMKRKRPILPKDINVNHFLTSKERQEILDVVNEYRDCFALGMEELGCTDVTKMDIKEVDGSKPVCLRPYKTTASEREAIREIVREWKDNGIVTETRSPYASPVLLVRKKTGDHRLVVDYRRLNIQTVKDKFPLPRIDDLLEGLRNAKFFTTLDLAHEYLQIPLTDKAKLKTEFITPDDTGQFERMIFGLANSPAEFQRLMHTVLGPLLNKKAFCYLDDVIIPAKDWREMIERLREVLERIRSAKLTLKPSKCEFGRREVEFLGYVISTGGLKPSPRKIKAIEEFPEPKNVHDIRRFLGLTNFFRRFVKDFARKAEPLSRLTKKGSQFEWKEEQRRSFGGLRKDLVEYPVLAHYNPELKTEVHCDASAEGLAGMVLQMDEDGKWRLVYCVSKKTTEAEKMYHSSKLELMAIVWTLDRLRQFLVGIKFTVVTDCQALVYMNAKKTTNPQIARWYNLIQEYDFEIRHKPGEKMAHVDGMSRAPVDDPRDTMEEIVEKNLEVCLTITLEEQILMIQHSDPELRDLIQIFRKDPCDRTVGEQNRINDYSYKGGRLFRMVKNGEEERALYVIPKSMRKSLVVKFHDLMGHFATDRTVNKIKELYWFPSMKRYVRRHVAMCLECLFNKVPGGKQQGFLHPIKSGKRPFSIVHMDHVGPFVRSTKGNQELLVIVDNLTRFVRLSPVRNTSTQNVLKVMKSFVNDFGLPDKIISDRGSCFTSRQFEEFCRGNGIHHTLNSTKHPQGNGMVERVNRTVLSTIATSIEDPRRKDWDLKIKEVERDLNNAVNKTTNKTPFETLHGYSPRFHDGILRRLADEDVDPWTEPDRIQESVRTQIENKQEIMKTYYDKKKCRTIQFEVGEIVVMRHVPKMTGEPTKAQPKYRGPLIITEVLPSDTYRVTQLSERTSGRFYTTTAHISQLKSWHSEEDDSATEESPDEEPEVEDTPRRNPRRSCNARFNRGRLKSRNGRMEFLKELEGLKQRVGETPNVFKERFMATRRDIDFDLDSSLVFDIFVDNILDKYKEPVVRSGVSCIDEAVRIMAMEDGVENRCHFKQRACAADIEEVSSLKGRLDTLNAVVGKTKHESEKCINDLKEEIGRLTKLLNERSQVSIIDSERCKVLNEDWDEAINNLKIVSVAGHVQTLTKVKTCRVNTEKGVELGDISFWLMSLEDKGYDGILGIKEIRRLNIPLPPVWEECNVMSAATEDWQLVDIGQVNGKHQQLVRDILKQRSDMFVENVAALKAAKVPPIKIDVDINDVTFRRQYVKTCPVCAENNGRLKKAPNMPIQPANYPFERLCVDFVGPLALSRNRNKYLLVFIDAFTRYAEVIPVRGCTAETAAFEFVNKIVNRYGTCKEILSDRGAAFESDLFREICKLYSIKKLSTTSYRPTCNSIVERVNGTICSILRHYANSRNWEENLGAAVSAYNNAVHSALGESPHYMLFGYDAVNHEVSDKDVSEFRKPSLAERLKEMQDARETVRKFLSENYDERVKKYKAQTVRTFETGDLVLLAVPKGKGSSKFSAKFYGHFRVVAKVSEVNFRVRGVNLHDEQVVHIDRMKAFRGMRHRKPTAAKRECYPRRRMIPLAQEDGSACRISPRREMSTPPLETKTVPDQEKGDSHDEPTVVDG
ncbi:hypothetical protein LAZ67_2005125, partial [Cordylochernes scorpioides]